ncbi:haloacid dehalogenase-like hydrolase [Nocardioides panacisoli]|uniref:HAD family hydrolase n=1 Tax=Nocardioides panacisoli TaxID=627624 RepID=UPI001C627CC8|nr:HAD family hydrolase [Nocardioides panacisoli]QYJ04823.1 haloacid dehalogenase-like hydrolase [Nocardioides panacisoli]
MGDPLPSWRPGAVRESVVAFLDAVTDVPVADRLACFDNDGTLWCERPTYVQFDYLIDLLRAADRADATIQDRPEYAAVLDGDPEAIGDLGLVRVALALTELCEGWTPEEFTASVGAFMARAPHPTLGRRHRWAVYQPMLELLDALRARDVTVSIVSGGGTEFVRAVSDDLYGVPPELVVGTMIAYDYDRDAGGRPRLRRTAEVDKGPNEGAAKVSAIQSQLGRRPRLAAGNSGGDREMLEWAAGQDGPSLALLVDHDDADREVAYTSVAQSFAEAEPITEVGSALGWTVVSMARDWAQVFPEAR